MTKCRLADAVITIPTAEFPSLNLGQAVLLIGYEWLKSADATPASRTRKTIARARLPRRTDRAVRASGARIGRSRVPLSAGEERDDGAQHARHDPAFAALSDQEVRTIRGMIVALVRNKYRGKA